MLTHSKLITWLLLALGIAGGVAPAAAQAPPPAGPVTYQTFYDALSPYGQWVEDPDYGYAWVPTAGPDFQPYRTSGHWVYTDYGWTWVSDYQWGWAAFHYGRWRYSDAYGWLWVPGYSWGPAWVAWRQSAGYYGWAPLAPPPPRRGGVHINIGFSFSFGDAPVAPAQWCFVPAAYVASPAIATYYVPPTQTAVVYNRTTIIHNTYVVNNVTNVTNNTVVNQSGGGPAQGGRNGQPAFPAGPAPADVQKATGQPLTPVPVSNRDKPGVGVQGKSLAFYRPEVAAPAPMGAQGSGAGAAPAASPAPRKVVPLAQAASLARRPLPNPGRGLLRDNAVQHLNSTEADSIRVAKQQAQADAATGSASPNPAASPRVATPARPGAAAPSNPNAPATAAAKQPAKAQPAPAAPTAATPPSRPAPSAPAQQQDHDQQRQARQQQQDQQHQTQQLAQQQAQAARQQQQQAQQQAQAARQQQQQAKQLAQQQQQQARQAQQQQQQARQAQQQQARQAQQQARQAQQQARQARPPHPEGREERR